MYGELSKRKMDILRAVVESHIKDGEPVGSRALTDGRSERGFALSSATIRNEMAELEQMGYLTHPHTSAGRVPSELGYRFYVDTLMRRYEMTAREIQQIEQTLRAKTAELDAILKTASQVVSRLTGYTSIAVKPATVRPTVMRFSITPVDENSFLLVMLLTKNVAKTRFIHSPLPLNTEVLQLLEHTLNECVAGRDLDTITLPVILEMERRMGYHSSLISPLIKHIYDSLSGEDSGGQLQLSGVEQLLHYQEFTDLDRLRNVFGVFDHSSDKLMELVDQADPEQVRVYIGRENELDAMSNSSLVFKKIVSGGKVIGAIGVIGPCRMNYSKVISTIQYLSDDIAGLMGNDRPTITNGGNTKHERRKEDDGRTDS